MNRSYRLRRDVSNPWKGDDVFIRRRKLDWIDEDCEISLAFINFYPASKRVDRDYSFKFTITIDPSVAIFHRGVYHSANGQFSFPPLWPNDRCQPIHGRTSGTIPPTYLIRKSDSFFFLSQAGPQDHSESPASLFKRGNERRGQLANKEEKGKERGISILFSR